MARRDRRRSRRTLDRREAEREGGSGREEEGKTPETRATAATATGEARSTEVSPDAGRDDGNSGNGDWRGEIDGGLAGRWTGERLRGREEAGGRKTERHRRRGLQRRRRLARRCEGEARQRLGRGNGAMRGPGARRKSQKPKKKK
ncbi:hypothetical protein ACLOJK_030664, partial [Asimina triloba]